MLVLAASPEPQHVVVSVNGCLDRLVINIWLSKSPWHEHVRRDVVRASHEHRDPIHLKVEGTTETVGI